MPRSKKGKYRPDSIWGKVKFDVLPPQGDPEVTITGPAALLAAGIIAGSIVAPGPGTAVGGVVGYVLGRVLQTS